MVEDIHICLFLLYQYQFSISYYFHHQQNGDFHSRSYSGGCSICATLTRVGMTLFDVPHRSLGAEITKDYDERTKLFSWRELFAWAAGISKCLSGLFYIF